MSELLLPAIISLGVLGLIFGLGLGLVSRRFAVKVDPQVERVLGALPGTNCGSCGMAGCCGFAEAVVTGKVAPDECIPGGPEVTGHLADILGVEVETQGKKVAKLKCNGSKDVAVDKFTYRGINDCRVAALLFGGDKTCVYGCLGLGSCVGACPFGAISMGEEGLPVIDASLCTGCGQCIGVCPRGVLALVPEGAQVNIACNSLGRGQQVKLFCKVGCVGCGICAKVCPQKAIVMEDNLPRIDYSKCNSCGVCVEKCPVKCIIKIQNNKMTNNQISTTK